MISAMVRLPILRFTKQQAKPRLIIFWLQAGYFDRRQQTTPGTGIPTLAPWQPRARIGQIRGSAFMERQKQEDKQQLALLICHPSMAL
jgi:hypothetical protein